MINKLFTAIAVSLIGIGVGVGVSGTAVAADDVYFRQLGYSFDLTSGPATPQGILGITVPAGTWVITAKANVVNFSQPDFARCSLYVGSTLHDGGATFIGGSPSAAVAEIVLQTVVTITSSELALLQCQHDYNTAGIYLDPYASMVVVKATGPIGP
jgi:hypothetical protein